MGYTIFTTEKPSVAQTYKNTLGVKVTEKTDGYIEGYSSVLNKNVQITWAVGHLIELATVPEQLEQKYLSAAEQKEHRWKKADLPILPKNYLYTIKKETAKQFHIIEKLYTSPNIDAIYYAGDAAREGIYIQALIRNTIFKGKDPSFPEYVIWIDSQTDEMILNGIQTAKRYHAYDSMIISGYERAITDFLIGTNGTEGLTLSCGGSLIAVGRVMTPTLAMVVNRQKEIDDFVQTDYYGINALTDTITAKWRADESSRYYDSPLLYNENGFLEESTANSFLQEFSQDPNLMVSSVKVAEKKETAPLLYNLADLQNYGSKNLHISPAQTLAIAQSLYEKKLITYPRTDSRYLSTAVAKDIKAKFKKTVPSKYVNDAKVTDHYALIPTFLKPSDLSQAETIVYNAIANRFKAIFEPAYIYDSATIIYTHNNGEHFYGNIKNVKQLGWKALYGEEMTPSVPLPTEQSVVLASFSINPMHTTPPSAYDTGSLVIAMEKAGKLIDDEELREQIKSSGIGTSATRANIIKKLEANGYITVDKRQKVAPTEIGKSIISVVSQVDDQLISPEKTAEMEQQLTDIVDGSISKEAYRTNVENYIIELVNKINTVDLSSVRGKFSKGKSGGTDCKCPACGNTLKYGKYGWYCNCGFNFALQICGHKMQEKDMIALTEKGRTATYTFTSKAGKKFKAFLTYDKDEKKTKLNFENNYSK